MRACAPVRERRSGAGLIKWKNAASRRLCRNNGWTIPQVPTLPPIPPSTPWSPSAWCLPGFITAPFITACLDNAVVVPIVPSTGMPSWPISPCRTFPRGESNMSDTTANLSSRGRENGVVECQARKKKKSSPRILCRDGFARRASVYRGTISLLSPRRSRVCPSRPSVADRERVKWVGTRWRKNKGKVLDARITVI